MLRKYGILATIFSMALAACGPGIEEENAESGDAYMITIGDDSPGFYVTLPDGSVFTNPDAYADAFPAVIASAQNDGESIAFRFHERVANDVDQSVRVTVTTNGDADVNISVTNKSSIGTLEQPLRVAKLPLPGGYFMTANVGERKSIGGCISAIAWPTATVRMHQNREPLWDMHAGAFQRNGKTCFGLFESEGGWTKCTCLPTYGDTVNGITASLIAAGLSAAAARIVAQSVTPVIVTGILILPVP